MSEIKVVARNRKARHDYFIEDTYEAGIVLKGSEIKSVRAGRVNLKGGFVMRRGEELWLMDVHIAPYAQSSPWTTHAPTRPRKLLLHRRQIDHLIKDIQRKGYTLVPLRLYLRRDYAKVELGLAKGKRQYDKRQDIVERDHERRMQREMKKFRQNH